MADLSVVQEDSQPSELDIARAQNIRLENLLTVTRQQLSNVMLQMADRDLEIAQLQNPSPTT